MFGGPFGRVKFSFPPDFDEFTEIITMDLREEVHAVIASATFNVLEMSVSERVQTRMNAIRGFNTSISLSESVQENITGSIILPIYIAFSET